MIEIKPGLTIDESNIQFDFTRASGPGGQNVNKVASAAQLRFDVNSADLPDDVRRRLIRLAGKRITSDGTLIIEAKRYRAQERNRQDALDRLVNLIRKASEKPKPRRKTKPSKAAKERRLESKRKRSQKKQRRGRVSRYDEE